MIVLDASVLVDALSKDDGSGDAARAELGRDGHWAGPEHLRVETFSAIRGRFLGAELSETRARDALDALAAAVVETVPFAPLLPRMWQLRENLTGYDAAYVAAAELHRCSLVTADVRLARAPGIECEVRLAV